MNLRNKKILAGKVFDVGISRISFNPQRLDEIKEAITRQDFKDLEKDGAIEILEIKGRRSSPKKRARKGPGSKKKTIKTRKQDYVKITRKLRNYIKELKKQEKITNEQYARIRKKIRARDFKSKSQLKEYLEEKR